MISRRTQEGLVVLGVLVLLLALVFAWSTLVYS